MRSGSAAPTIIVLGGGVAGLTVASRLGDQLGRNGRARIVLIDKSFTHVWKPILHRFAAGTQQNDNDRVGLALQAHRRGFEFWPGDFAGADRRQRILKIGPVLDRQGRRILEQRTMAYDFLIVALGSRANDFAIPGVGEHCMFVDTPIEADAFNTSFREGLVRSFADGSPLAIAIVGGGATGVQLAAELLKARELSSLYHFGAQRPVLQITLLESSDRILPAFPQAVSKDALRQLEALGVKVLTSAQVTEADKAGLVLADGRRVDATLRAWVAGVRAPAATAAFEGLELSRSGQLLVRPSLQATRDERIFAIGDCARMDEKPLPATAQVAHQQARYLSTHLPRWLKGAPPSSFSFSNRGSVVELGDFDGWLTLPDGRAVGGEGWRGLPAQWAHSLLYQQHQLALYGPVRGAIACVAEWLTTFVLPPVRLG